MLRKLDKRQLNDDVETQRCSIKILRQRALQCLTKANFFLGEF